RAENKVREEKEEKSEASSEEGSEGNPEADGEPVEQEASKKKSGRPVFLTDLEFHPDGGWVLFQAFSRDHKDRWLLAVELPEDGAKPRLVTLGYWRDDAWINRRFARAGWLEERGAYYFISEHTGYGHLYRGHVDDEEASHEALTSGNWEVSRLIWNRAKTMGFFTGNEAHPGMDEVYRIRLSDGRLDRLTFLKGKLTFRLSPDEKHLLLLASSKRRPAELHLKSIDQPDQPARRLTHSVSDRFASMDWVEPEVVPVPSRHGRPIYSRLYRPPFPKAGAPAVLFVHGAGYLQNAHHGWSSYFRECLFHQMLVREGYVVLDMDYRASAGYGRDWRTAIYREMGTPELEDLEDGVQWLVANEAVARDRVGVYGGSYGGFLTLMALFKKPDLFACGAALRPVTDWAHYNHGYTSRILNTPAVDPLAYRRSSPIFFAEGLRKPLLMCHGMVDDNVFFKDTVRLAQRLIELEKENWETAIYPVEAHGFRAPTSWLDEYRRIHRLFRTHLKPGTVKR
ncbi:MAG: prolyl oligopeptidase family serine peptidase, partial [Verrucomicrobiota bacterium]